MTIPPIIFDRQRVRTHRARAAAQTEPADFLLREMAERLSDRLLDMARTFPMALDLGAHHCLLAWYVKGMAGIEQVIQADMSLPMLRHAHGACVVADEETLPFAENSFEA